METYSHICSEKCFHLCSMHTVITFHYIQYNVQIFRKLSQKKNLLNKSGKKRKKEKRRKKNCHQPHSRQILHLLLSLASKTAQPTRCFIYFSYLFYVCLKFVLHSSLYLFHIGSFFVSYLFEISVVLLNISFTFASYFFHCLLHISYLFLICFFLSYMFHMCVTNTFLLFGLKGREFQGRIGKP